MAFIKHIAPLKYITTVICVAAISLSACGKKDYQVEETSKKVVPDFNKTYTFDSKASWVQEFNSNGKPDASQWGYDVGGGGWGNNELEYYTNGSNVTMSGGNLVITARKQSMGGMKYTSARLFSKGNGNFLYGRFVVAAKVPAGLGTWPAIWFLPTDKLYGDWPNSGEIDLMEHVGYDPINFYFTVHTSVYNHTLGTQKGSNMSFTNATTEYHVFRLDWTPTSITGYIDDQQIYTFINDGKNDSKSWPFDQKFHLMLNLAIGGDWGGAQGVDDTAFPQSMLIDYIRYYPVNNL